MSNVTTLQDDPRQHGDGGRIYLRKLVPDDVGEAYLGWFRDPIVTEYLDLSLIHISEPTRPY